MVHDLKTPLSSIIMTLRPLHEGRLDDKPALRDRYFQIARDEADHLLALTNKILTISKLENHKMHMSPEPLPLQPLLDALAERLAPKCPKPLRITADLHVPTLLADPEYWPEVMLNLVDNAIKYTRPDADAVEIHVSTHPAGRHETELRIRDNGRGISRCRKQRPRARLRAGAELRTTGSRGARRAHPRRERGRKVDGVHHFNEE